MGARVAIALYLAVLAWAGSARAQDNPACAQYHEAMAYNLCLSQHGPKANNLGTLRGGAQSGGGAHSRAWNTDVRTQGHAARFYHWRGAQPAQRVHGRVHVEFPVR